MLRREPQELVSVYPEIKTVPGTPYPIPGDWSLGYNASAMGWRGTSMPLIDRTDNAVARRESAGIGQRPIVFVARSQGGLRVKQMK